MRLVDTVNKYIDEYLKNHELYSTYGIVSKVSSEMCTVKIDGQADIEVRLFFKDSDWQIIPEVNSKCIITFTSNSEAYFSMVEKVQEIVVNAEKDITLTSSIALGGTGGEKAVKGQSLNQLLTQLMTYLQVINAALITYSSAQAIEFPAIAGSNTALTGALSAQTAILSQIITQLPNHLATKVTLK